MSSPPEVLLGILDDLGGEDFERFKWHLGLNGVLEGFKPIPKSKLEKLDRQHTVDVMCHTYSNRTLKVTEIVLGKMNMMGLWEKHCKNILEPEAMAAPTTMSRNQPRMARDVPADQKLFQVRPSFVEKVSNSVLDTLLDKLLHCGVLTGSEYEELRKNHRLDKARELIDTVRKKGDKASSDLIAALAATDWYCCRELGLC